MTMTDVSIAQLEEMLVPTGNEDDDWLPLVKVRREKTAEGAPFLRFRFCNVDGSLSCPDAICMAGDVVDWSFKVQA